MHLSIKGIKKNHKARFLCAEMALAGTVININSPLDNACYN